ncbi:MAG: hypothetical protein HC929_19235 [Leptolyngbyaceae cyanobacterium SM2_5_2]|nr:hypothetical protein [Leptolyngbyaceae cyanobacterium SM2_5_2]
MTRSQKTHSDRRLGRSYSPIAYQLRVLPLALCNHSPNFYALDPPYNKWGQALDLTPTGG